MRAGTRGLVCKLHEIKTHTSIQVQRKHPTFPAQWLYGLYVVSPVSRAFLPPSPALLSCELDTSVGVPGPHDFTVRSQRARLARRHVHRNPPRVRDVRETPL